MKTPEIRLAVAYSMLVLAGCRQQLPSPAKPSWGELIRESRAVWNAAQIRDYDLVVDSGWVLGSTHGPRKMEVRGGEVTSVVFVETGLAVSAAERESMVLRVEDLFVVLEDADKKPNARIQATFDREFGYPTKLRINWNVNLTDAVTWVTAELQNPLRAT
jgi:Family of unknown function (DUF6174)